MQMLSNEILKKELECPVCCTYMQGSIHECISGHSFCLKCYRKLVQCAICRLPLSYQARNITLELLSDTVIVPCINEDSGCTTTKFIKEIGTHQSVCKLGDKPCPIAVEVSCSWFGSYDKIYDHVKDIHKDRICTKKDATIVIGGFIKGRASFHAAHAIVAHQQVFKVILEVDIEKAQNRFCVFLTNGSLMGESFSYGLKMKNVKGEKFEFSGECPVLRQNVESQFKSLNTFLELSAKFVKDCCNKTGDLKMVVTINKNERIIKGNDTEIVDMCNKMEIA